MYRNEKQTTKTLGMNVAKRFIDTKDVVFH